MTIHKEGYSIITTAIVLLGIFDFLIWYVVPWYFLQVVLLGTSFIFFVLILQFFRSPLRKTAKNPQHVISPADGKVVAIEEVYEGEYFKEKRIQVSIFMSPLNVHVNWYPITGIVSYYRYHPGKYLVAWHPKSSEENERTTVVVGEPGKTQVLFRQIAGAVARRIICYAKESTHIEQGQQCGFIRFGSRVDVFLPLGTDIKVSLEEKVLGCTTVIAVL